MTAPALPFTPSPAARAAVMRAGVEQLPIVRIDGLLADPHRLIDHAAQHAAFESVAGNYYPGVRAAMPLDYVDGLVRALDPLIRSAFAPGAVRLARAECFFSIVTTPPAALAPGQTAPHIDTTDPLQFAAVHFLCDEGFGGTSLYRQNATGFEQVTPDRAAAWDAARIAALSEDRTPGYMLRGDADYAEIAHCPAAFDRLLLYRSNQLHSGIIPAAMPLDPDPRRGRLTATLFIAYRPV